MNARLEWTAIGISLLSFTLSIVTGYATWSQGRDMLRATDIDQRRQERAYLGVEDVRLLRYRVGARWKLVYTIENYGHTPAIDVRGALAAGVHDRPIAKHQTDAMMAELRVRSGASTINHQQVKSVTGPVLEPPQMQEIAAGRKALVFFGRVYYRDVFGDPHETRYCFTVRILVAGELMQGMCRFGNEAR